MMKRYFDQKDFISFLNLLEEGKNTELCVECLEDGHIDKAHFLKMKFMNEDIILYDNLYGSIGIIQSTPVAFWDDYAEAVYEDMISNGEYKIFIEAK